MSKNNYLVKVSRQPELTAAELSAKLSDVEFTKLDQDYLQIRTAAQLDQKFIDQIGSTPKIYRILETLLASDLDNLAEFINPTIGSFALNWEPSKKYEYELKKQQLIQLKKSFKKQVDGKIRYLNKGVSNVKDAYLLAQGFTQGKVTEYLVTEWGYDYLLLEAVGIQDINSYSFRDFKKPARDMQRGMFPPKLAQILINLGISGFDTPTVYDPFCGIGTVAIEAALMQIPSYNSDISEKAITDTQTNLEWTNHKFKTSNTKWQAFTSDATKLDQNSVPWEQITSIVTEGYLGPIVHKPTSPTFLPEEIRQIEQMYSDFLRSLSKQVKKGTKVAFCLPVYRTTETKFHFCKNIVENLKKLGYSKPALFADHAAEKLGLQLTERNTIVYIRSNQYVGREIVLAQKD